jgi:hypothetical protein
MRTNRKLDQFHCSLERPAFGFVESCSKSGVNPRPRVHIGKATSSCLSSHVRLPSIREAIRQEGMVGIGKVVFTSREHIIALEARGKGMLGITLR